MSASKCRDKVMFQFHKKKLTPEDITAKNTVISPDFLVWKFCGKAQFPHHKIRSNYGIFRCVLFNYNVKSYSVNKHITETWNLSRHLTLFIIWVKVFKNRLSKICESQPTWSILECLHPYIRIMAKTVSKLHSNHKVFYFWTCAISFHTGYSQEDCLIRT